MNQRYTGVNIQFPISRLILEGEKTIETRTYPLPEKYENKVLLFVETPGKEGKFKSRIVAKIKFGKSFLYDSEKSFYEDFEKHKVNKESQWAWKSQKWGWPILEVKKLRNSQPLKKRPGIKFTTELEI